MLIKKILILSDTHGDETQYVKIIEKTKPDRVLHAGDFYDTKNPDIIFNQKKFLKYVDYFVDGNHGLKHNKWKQYKKIDNDTDKSIFYFDNLINDYQVFTINQKKFLLIHIFKAAHDDFWLTSKWDEYKEKVNAIIERYKVDYVVFGHTHKAEIIQKNNFLALNPGSLTRPELQPTGSYIIGKWINNSFVFKIKYLKK